MPNAQDHRRKGTRQLRKGRYSDQNHIYHVTTSTHQRAPLFANLTFGRILVQAMQREQEAGHAETLAFVIMPDHWHWLLRLSAERSLSSSMSTVKSYTTRMINDVSKREGRLWQPGFYDRAMRKEDDIVGVARYIIANPVRAGIARSVRDYSLWDSVWV